MISMIEDGRDLHPRDSAEERAESVREEGGRSEGSHYLRVGRFC